MVMSEALTCGVPVVFSDQCGAADHLRSDGLRILRVDAPVADWAGSCRELAGRTFTSPPSRTWSDVAAEHEELYAEVVLLKRR
jgi:hypothetical protein